MKKILVCVVIVLVVSLFKSSNLMAELKPSFEYKIEPNPDGKIIRRIIIVPIPPFVTEKKDNTLKFFTKVGNALHWQTSEGTIKDELLFKVGEPYSKKKVNENLKVLLSIKQFSDANVVPVQVAGMPSKVDVVVIVRDLWAIQVNLKPEYKAGESNIDISTIWRNAFGLRKEFEFKFHRDIYRYDTTFIYTDPRIMRSDWLLVMDAMFAWRNENREYDGARYSILIDKPFRSVYDKWHFAFHAAYDKGTYRFYEGSSPKKTVFRNANGTVVSDAEAKEIIGRVPPDTNYTITDMSAYKYNKRIADFTVERGFGTFFKWIVGMQASLVKEDYDVFPDTNNFLTTNSFSEERYLNAIAPRKDDTSVGIILGNQWIDNQKLRNINKFKVLEVFEIGYVLKFTTDVSNKQFMSSDDYFKFKLEGRWGAYPIDWLLFLGEHNAETRLSYESNDTYETIIKHELKAYLLKVIYGAIGINLAGAYGKKNKPEEPFFLGGNIGLRGYGANFVKGNRLLRGTLEYRTPPIDFYVLDLGTVVFYDVGKAWNEDTTDIDKVETYHGIGFGLRTMALFLNQNMFRFDFGIPISQDKPFDDLKDGKLNAYISAEFKQAF